MCRVAAQLPRLHERWPHKPPNELHVVLARARELKPMDFSVGAGLGLTAGSGGGTSDPFAELAIVHGVREGLRVVDPKAGVAKSEIKCDSDARAAARVAVTS